MFRIAAWPFYRFNVALVIFGLFCFSNATSPWLAVQAATPVAPAVPNAPASSLPSQPVGQAGQTWQGSVADPIAPATGTSCPAGVAHPSTQGVASASRPTKTRPSILSRLTQPSSLAKAAPRVTSGPAQTISTTFEAASLTETNSDPPDTMGAVGPSQYMLAVNGLVRTFNKTTGTQDGALDCDLTAFFGSVLTPVSNTVATTPRLRYDRTTQRWILLAQDRPGNSYGQPNRILVAVSSSGTITTGTVWNRFYFDTAPILPPGDTTDFPTLGLDDNALYIGAIVRNSNLDIISSTAFVVRKSSVLGSGPLVVTAFPNLVDASSGDSMAFPQGVDNMDTNPQQGYFIGVSNLFYNELIMRYVYNPALTPTLSSNIVVGTPATSLPLPVPHSGVITESDKLTPTDDRLTMAVIRHGGLWTTHAIGVDNQGNAADAPTATRNAVRWYHLDQLTTAPRVLEANTIYDPTPTNLDPGHFYWMPSLMVSGQDHLALGFSASSITESISAATTGQLTTDDMITRPVQYIVTGTSTYNPPGGAYDPDGINGVNYRQWGNYSYTSLDPEDDMTMWTAQEYNDGPDSYAIGVSKLLAPPPATPYSVTPDQIEAGQSSVIITVTAQSIDGSGFYEPGPAFSKHFRVSVGASVTVLSIISMTTTQLVLNVSTVGTPPGPRGVTATNPDGQSIRTPGLLMILPPCPSNTNVTSPSDDGTGVQCGTLSRALTRATSASSPVTITLSTSAITLAAPLPTITNTQGFPITIVGSCTGGQPGTQLIGSGLSSPALTLTNNISLSGLKITGFGDYALKVLGSRNTLNCNWLGTSNGVQAAPNGGGILLAGSNNTLTSNLISGNNGPGLKLPAGSLGNLATGNRIGVRFNSLARLRNTGGNLLLSLGANLRLGPGNVIGS